MRDSGEEGGDNDPTSGCAFG